MTSQFRIDLFQNTELETVLVRKVQPFQSRLISRSATTRVADIVKEITTELGTTNNLTVVSSSFSAFICHSINGASEVIMVREVTEDHPESTGTGLPAVAAVVSHADFLERFEASSSAQENTPPSASYHDYTPPPVYYPQRFDNLAAPFQGSYPQDPQVALGLFDEGDDAEAYGGTSYSAYDPKYALNSLDKVKQNYIVVLGRSDTQLDFDYIMRDMISCCREEAHGHLARLMSLEDDDAYDGVPLAVDSPEFLQLMTRATVLLDPNLGDIDDAGFPSPISDQFPGFITLFIDDMDESNVVGFLIELV